MFGKDMFKCKARSRYICFFLFTVYLIFLCRMIWKIKDKRYEYWLNDFSYLLLISLAVILLLLIAARRYLNDFSVLFIVLSFVFHLSHVLLMAVDYDFGETVVNIPFVRYDPESAMKAFNIALISICMVFWGMGLEEAVALNFKRHVRFSLKRPEKPFAFGLCLMFAAFPLFAYQTALFLWNTIHSGYGVAANLPQNSYIRLMGEFLLPSFILMMTAPEIKLKTSKMILLAGCVTYFIAMLTGQRAYNLMYVCILILIYLFGIKEIRIKAKGVIAGIVALYFLFFFLSLIRLTRVQGMSVDLLVGSLKAYKKNPVLDMINEFAITGNVITHVIKETDIPAHGRQFLTAFLIIIPGVSKIFPLDFSKYNLTDKLEVWNLGGSYIADFYYDFGYGVFLACIIWGWLLNRIFSGYCSLVKKKRYFEAAFLSPIICELLFSIRSTTYKIPRAVLFYSVVFFAIYFLYIIVRSLTECIVRRA